MAIQLVCLLASTGAMLVARSHYRRTEGLRRALQARVVVEVDAGGRPLRYLDASVAELVAARDCQAPAEVLYLTRAAGHVRVLFRVEGRP